MSLKSQQKGVVMSCRLATCGYSIVNGHFTIVKCYFTIAKCYLTFQNMHIFSSKASFLL